MKKIKRDKRDKLWKDLEADIQELSYKKDN